MNAQQIQNPQVKALGPGDADDGDAGRQQRGLVIAALAQIEKNRVGYKVPSQSGSGAYVVNLDGEPFCPTFPIWLNIPLSKSSAFFKPLSICETLAVGMAIITP